MPSEKRHPLGLPSNFMPIWDLFINQIGDKNRSDVIRKLIFAYVNGDVGLDDNNLLDDDDWDALKQSLKIYQKFIKKELDLNQRYKNFYVTKWDDFFAPVYSEKEIEDFCKEFGYEVDPAAIVFPSDIAISLRKRKSKFGIQGIKGIGGIESELRLSKNISKPNSCLIILVTKEDSFRIIENAYMNFKKNKEATIYDLIKVNNDLAFHFSDEFNFFNWPAKLMEIPIVQLKQKNFREMFKKIDGREFGEKPNTEDYLRRELDLEYLEKTYGKIIHKVWKETPSEISDFLVLKPYHLKSKKNLRDFKRNNRKIMEMQTRILEFDVSKNNKIIRIPLSEEGAGLGWDKAKDVSDQNNGQIIGEA